MPERKFLLQQWVAKQLDMQEVTLHAVSGDASFRIYYRVGKDSDSYIVVDSDPEKENNNDFIRIARSLFAHGFHAPEIFAAEDKMGFILLSDLGDQLLLPKLTTASVDTYYRSAMKTLRSLQAQLSPTQLSLPQYDHSLLMAEMSLFSDWFIERYIAYSLGQSERDSLNTAYEMLAGSALAQKLVFVHRDYHARNIMLLDNGELGLIDFQDAVWGPITYDLVSILRDCYIRWPRQQTLAWAADYFHAAQQQGILDSGERLEEFLRAFEWMGMQRHLKAVGIFSRLNFRDNKPVYLGDIPRTYRYLLEVAAAYPQLSSMSDVLKSLAVQLVEKDPEARNILQGLL